MRSRQDPVQKLRNGQSGRDDVVDWGPQTLLDKAFFQLYSVSIQSARVFVVLVGVWILVEQLSPFQFAPTTDPILFGYVVLSVLPAFLLAVYVWHADITGGGPIWLLVVTFLLGICFAAFAAVINGSLGSALLIYLGERGVGQSAAMAILFFVVVGPAEELVKLAAVRFQAWRTVHFNAVISGAVYGAAAGLGFATIENTFYITQVLDGASGLTETLREGGSIASARALAAPGHVIWSAIAGYYLGLARFNRRHRGAIIFKGLSIAILAHALYNVLVTNLPVLLADTLGTSPVGIFFAFAVVYNGLFFAYLLYKLSAYRDAHRSAFGGVGPESELTEFDA